MQRTPTFLAMLAVLATSVSRAAAGPIPISDLVSAIQFNLADGQPIPDNLFDTSGPNPFSNTTVIGFDTEALVYTQTFEVQRGANVNVVGLPDPHPRYADGHRI